MPEPCRIYTPGSGAYEFVDKEYTAYTDRIRNLSVDAAVDIAALSEFTPDFSSLKFEVSTEPFDNIDLPVIALPEDETVPEYLPPESVFNTEPPEQLSEANFDDGSGIRNVGNIPNPDYGQLVVRTIAVPNIVLPPSVGPSPVLPDRVEPTEPTLAFPNDIVLRPVPDAGPAPEIDGDLFDKPIPVFQPPNESLQDVYFADHTLKQGEVAAFVSSQAELPEVRAALTAALNGDGIIVPA